MKINKILKESTFITEAEDIEEVSDVSEPIDTEQSVQDIAIDIIDQTKEANEIDLTQAEAEVIAQDIKAGAELLDTGTAFIDTSGKEHLNTENKLTRALDRSLKKARTDQRLGLKSEANVLVTGLPGSGKTSTIYDWGHSRGLNIVSVNAKNNDLQAFIDGFTVRDPNDPYATTNAYSNNLAVLDKPNSILFLDEFNRQIKPQIRAALLTLLNEHTISGKGEHNIHFFKGLLFTIAAINPAVPTDKGAAPLNQAERSRFLYKTTYDSNVEATLDYLKKHYKELLGRLNPKNPEYLEDIEMLLRELDLGIFTLTHPRFMYGTLSDLEDAEDQNKTVFNQRTFTDLLSGSYGDPEEFLALINNTDIDTGELESDLMDKDINMLTKIVQDYIRPTFDELLAAYDFDIDKGVLSTSKAATDTASAQDDTNVAVDNSLEDDEDLFTNSSSLTTKRAPSAAEAANILKNAINKW